MRLSSFATIPDVCTSRVWSVTGIIERERVGSWEAALLAIDAPPFSLL